MQEKKHALTPPTFQPSPTVQWVGSGGLICIAVHCCALLCTEHLLFTYLVESYHTVNAAAEVEGHALQPRQQARRSARLSSNHVADLHIRCQQGLAGMRASGSLAEATMPPMLVYAMGAMISWEILKDSAASFRSRPKQLLGELASSYALGESKKARQQTGCPPGGCIFA